MAMLQMEYMSTALLRTVQLTVLLPVDKVHADGSFESHKPYKTLYLLHGLFGSGMDWVTGTRIRRWAQEKNLAVVMPSGENSFYVDWPRGGSFTDYGRFVGEELVRVTREAFPLSHRREDTFIGGLSMGGYGAVRNGLKYADTFGAILSFSGALHLFEKDNEKDGLALDSVLSPLCFGEGDVDALVSSDVNPRVTLEALAQRKRAGEAVELPKIYMACGTEDGLLESNRLYRDLFRENGYDLTYEEAPGGHDWDFWDTFIRRTLDWLPLEGGGESLSSGSIDA